MAYRHQYGSLPEPRISGGKAHSNRILNKLGFGIVDAAPTTIEGERAWRHAVWAHLRTTNEDMNRVAPRALREFGAYGGGQGIWADVARTGAIHKGGIAVGVLHTGAHYPDDLAEDGALYRYPKTERGTGRDTAEIDAMKAAAQLRLPIFVLAKPTPRSKWRIVRFAWVEGWDDRSSTFLLSYEKEPPTLILSEDHSDSEPFGLTGNGSRRERRNVRVRPGQPRFKLRVFQRYTPRCPLSGVSVPEMLEAAHLCPVAEDGTNDPRNGIPLNAALHRAYDAYLFAFHPDTLDVVTVPGGPTLDDMRITKGHLRDLPKRPHADALRWRYEEWLRRSGLAVLPSLQSAEPIPTI
ncbi:HNH endonuclease [Streptomyces sp. SID486]|nr:HNH endonuclease [Streptomyces sp. SID486]